MRRRSGIARASSRLLRVGRVGGALLAPVFGEVFFAEIARAIFLTGSRGDGLDPTGAENPYMATGDGQHGRGELAERTVPTQGSALINAALRALADGHERDAARILADAVKAGWLPATTRKITLYASLSQYVQRSIAHGRRPLIVQNDVTHAFRINHPVDDWPDVPPPSRPPPVPAARIEAIATKLHATSTATAPAAFEEAVCEAFDALGFVATHLGGNGNPDGLLDAPLGPLAYRAIIECKTAHADTTVNAPRLEEPARFREAYHAQYALLVGPAFAVDGVFESEMKNHAVSVWSVNDIVNTLGLGVDPLECRELFEAGVVEDRLADLAWAREHGAEKRLTVIAALLHKTAWAAQKALVGRVYAADQRFLCGPGGLVQKRGDHRQPFLGAVFARPGEVGKTVLDDAGLEQLATLERIDTETQRVDDVVHGPDRDGVVLHLALEDAVDGEGGADEQRILRVICLAKSRGLLQSRRVDGRVGMRGLALDDRSIGERAKRCVQQAVGVSVAAKVRRDEA